MTRILQEVDTYSHSQKTFFHLPHPLTEDEEMKNPFSSILEIKFDRKWHSSLGNFGKPVT